MAFEWKNKNQPISATGWIHNANILTDTYTIIISLLKTGLNADQMMSFFQNCGMNMYDWHCQLFIDLYNSPCQLESAKNKYNFSERVEVITFDRYAMSA